MNWYTDLDVSYSHENRYNDGTKRRYDPSPTKKTLEGRRFVVEVAGFPDGNKPLEISYWKTLRDKIKRAKRRGDVVMLLNFHGLKPDRIEDLLDAKLYPALVRHGIIK